MGKDMGAAKRKASATRGARSMCVRGVKYAVVTARDILYAINKCKTIKSWVKQSNVPERERYRSLLHELCSSAAPLLVPEFTTAVRQRVTHQLLSIDGDRNTAWHRKLNCCSESYLSMTPTTLHRGCGSRNLQARRGLYGTFQVAANAQFVRFVALLCAHAKRCL